MRATPTVKYPSSTKSNTFILPWKNATTLMINTIRHSMAIERSSLFSAPSLRLTVGVKDMRPAWTTAQIDAAWSPSLVNLASFKRKIASRAAPCIATDSHQSFLIVDIFLLFFILRYYCNYFFCNVNIK